MVIMHWTCSKITASLAIPDATLLEILLEKVVWFSPFLIMLCVLLLHLQANQSPSYIFQLKLSKGISYAAVAAHADKNGRRKLAAMLVEHEPRSSKQVLFSSIYLFFKIFLPCFLSFIPWAETYIMKMWKKSVVLILILCFRFLSCWALEKKTQL